MTSQARSDSARRNGSRGKGPVSPEGRSTSSKNALKHGMCSETDVIAGEDAAAYAEHRDAFIEELGAQGAVETALAEAAARAAWKLTRAHRNELAHDARRRRDAADSFHQAERARVRDLGRKLLADPLNRCTDFQRDDRSLRLFDAWFAEDPALILAELERTATGLDFLLEQWSVLDGVLHTEGFWHYPEKSAAIRMTGRRSEDVLNDPVILKVFLDANATHIAPWEFFDDVMQARLGIEERPAYFERVNFLAKGLKQITEAGGEAGLRAFMEAEVARLKALREDPALAARAAADRAEAAARSLFDDGPPLALRLRYEAQAERSLYKSLSELTKLREAAPSRPAPRPVAQPAPAPESPAVGPNKSLQEAKLRNEPAVEPARPASPPVARNEPNAGGPATD